MTWKRKRIRAGERTAGYAVLAVLVILAVWLAVTQTKYNQAVVVALSHPTPTGKTGIQQAQQSQQTGTVPASQTAAFLGSITGAVAASPVEVFNAETLSDKIDGKAELYLASGFQEMAVQAFTANTGKDGPAVRVEVFLYAMGSPDNAFAVFSGQRRAGGDPLTITANAYATENALFFAKDRYYAEFIADQAGPAVRPILAGMAQSLAAALPTESGGSGGPGKSGVASDSALFPKGGLQKDTIQLAVSDALGMAGLENVYTAQYTLQKGEAAAFLAVRQSPQAASEQAKAYAAFLASMGFKEAHLANAPENAMVMTMDTMTQVVLTRGNVLAGVHDAANREAALELARNLAKTLEEKAQ